MDPLQYLITVVEGERESNDEFRTEMRNRVGAIEQRLAVQDALAADGLRKRKIYAGVIGTLIAIFSAIVPFWVK